MYLCVFSIYLLYYICVLHRLELVQTMMTLVPWIWATSAKLQLSTTLKKTRYNYLFEFYPVFIYCWPACLSVRWSVSRSAGWSVGRVVGQSVGWLVDWMDEWMDGISWNLINEAVFISYQTLLRQYAIILPLDSTGGDCACPKTYDPSAQLSARWPINLDQCYSQD